MIDRAEHLPVADGDVQLQVHAPEPANAERIGAGNPRHAGRVHRHHERGDPFPPQSGPRAREDDRHRCHVGVGDPHLAAGNPVAVARLHRLRFLIRGVRARVGLRQRERADGIAGGQPPQPLLLLVGPAGMGDQIGDERVLDDKRYGDRGAGRGDRLDRQDVAQKVEPGAAPLARQRRPEQAAAGSRAHHVERVLTRFIDPRRPRRDHLTRELLDRLLEGEMFGRELENHDSVEARHETTKSSPENTQSLFKAFPRALRALRVLALCVMERFAASLEPLENRLQSRDRFPHVLRQHSRAADDRHEIRVARPARHEVDVDVVDDAGAGRAAEVDADVDALGWYASPSAISASRANAIISASSSGVVSTRDAMWRFGTTIRWPLLYGYRLRMTYERSPRTSTSESWPDGSGEGSAASQKTQRALSPV